ncbi:MAG: SAM-dependent chlorinase/fluorinase [Candidatus Hydrogenedentota bacterium]
MPSLVTLTTDFEERDANVASIKGMLYSRYPGVQVEDLSHDIPRNHVTEGALFLAGAIPYFPEGTVHITCIAAGSSPIAISMQGQTILCPDNGVVTFLSKHFTIDEARVISNPEVVLSGAGQTFFGRDVFAPAAAVLASGGQLSDLGEVLDSPKLLDLLELKIDGATSIGGQVILVNRFGSLISNIHESDLGGSKVARVEVADFPVGGIVDGYGQVGSGLPLALFGSSGYLEIAYNGDRADERLNARIGNNVNVTLESA